MTAAYVAADLLVGRAGSSTLAEATAAGLPMVLVPYPHAASHQEANTRAAEAAGAAVIVPDEQLDGDALRRAADLLFDERLARMAAASRSLARPGAAAATAGLLVSLVERASLPDPETVDAQTRALA
jgi:UDP-N-acetylglucosamine--N-acetylmuramyl-(pentapeptide) pyrophosphoryl-undecaprenol N-acetylglucosamine transferase